MLLVGRGDEQRALERLLAAARAGLGGSLLLGGEAGIGKTALLHHAARSAPDFDTVMVSGAEDEVGYGFAALQRFLQPLHHRLRTLSGANIDAARSAFGMRDGALADRFVVGLALLDVLAAVSVDRPVLCIVDDAQWLDAESLAAFALVARRTQTERLVVLFGARDTAPIVPGVPELRVQGLSERAGLELLRQVAHGRLEDDLARRVVAETGGSPLGIIELAQSDSVAELDDMGDRPEPLPIARRLEDHFLRAVRLLPETTQTLLLLKAADTTGDDSVVWEAAARLGIAKDDVEAARRATVINHTTELEFRHPLIRSAVYSGADVTNRRRVHGALAAALAVRGDTTRHAWHLAAAAPGPLEEAARQLDLAALGAAERGAHGSAATLWRRAAELSADPHGRGERLLAAASAQLAAGAPERARALLERAEDVLTDPFQRARRMWHMGATRYVLGEAVGTTAMLISAARDLHRFDVDLARDALRYAMTSARIAGRFARPEESYWHVLAVAETIPPPPRHQPTLADRIIEAQATLWVDYARAVDQIRSCVDELIDDDDVSPTGLMWTSFACWAAGAIADDTRFRALAVRLVADGRRRQVPEALANGLMWLGICELMNGSLRAARSRFAERASIRAAVGHRVTEETDIFDVVMSAWAGQRDETKRQAEIIERAALERSHGWVMSYLEYAVAVLELGLGNYAASFAAAMKDFRDHPIVAVMGFPDVIEAAVRCGERTTAERILGQVTTMAPASGTPLALGLLARSRALLADDDEAEQHYLTALTELRRARSDVQVARTELVYGEWLRRRRRRADAREQLRAAHATFDALGAAAFAARARIELAATGAHARPRTLDTINDLTAHESQIAELAAAGATNAEIGATLFISASTVDYHLGKIYRKLGITSRRELPRPSVNT